MRVILLEDVAGLGKKYEIKEVKDGYAKNYLLPRKLAVQATEKEIKKLELLKNKFIKQEEELIRHLTELKRLIEDRTIEFYLKTDKNGKVFGSVNKEMILKALREHKLITKERVNIILNRPIKEIGEHQIDIDLKKGIVAKLRIIIHPQP